MITIQPVHTRTLAASASFTATSAVPKPLALWTSPLVSQYLCLCVDGFARACISVSVCLCACVSVYFSMCVCVSVCVKSQTFWYREALTPNVRCEAGQDRGDRRRNYWKMLIVQDGSAHSARALSSTTTASAPRLTRSHPLLTFTAKVKATCKRW